MTAHLYCGTTIDISETGTGGGLYPTRLTTPSPSLGVVALADEIITLNIPSLDEYSAAVPNIASGSGVETVTYSLPIDVESIGKASQLEIQSITHSSVDNTLIGCIDNSGGVYLHRVIAHTSDLTKKVKTTNKSLNVDRLKGVPHARPCEYSWAGLSFSQDGGMLGICQGMGRWVGNCDVQSGNVISLGWTSRSVRDLSWFNSTTLAFAETETLTLWDIRSEAKTSSFSRCLPTSKGTLNCVSTMGDHFVACAGNDRTIHIVDNRTMKVVKHWRSPCKFDITSLHPSSETSGVIYLSGLDNEILTCNTGGTEKSKQKQKRRPKLGTTNSGGSVIPDGSKESSGDTGLANAEEVVGGHGRLHQSHNLGIRGDARWIGVAMCKSQHEEFIMGLSANGTLNILQSPDRAKHARG